MKLKSLWPVLGLTLILASGPSLAEPYEDGYAAYGRGDYATAFQIWNRLADDGNQSGQYGLGELYSLGRGVPQDNRQAARWYERAAANGHVSAQSRLGALYDKGLGVPQNLSKAMKWYRRAAQQGDLAAQLSLGLIYGTGRGVPQNYFQAEKWFRLAAEQGDALAQYNLGLIYSGGHHVVPKDDVQALVWLSLAAKGGNEEAVKMRESLAKGMSPEKVAEADKFAQDWMMAKAQDRAARCSMLGAGECK
ncbi:MAG: sel1 repeat family protein [Rhizobiales bacterium]|nr:sel1 repeat family protein [Hyphomicrobiales bacterium]